MKEMINKIQALIESEKEEIKEIENVRRKVKARLDSDESLSLSTYRTLIRMLAEFDLQTSLHTTFIQMLKDILSENLKEKENLHKANKKEEGKTPSSSPLARQ